MSATINAEDARIVAEAVLKALPDVWLMRSPICTRAEAMAFARVRSDTVWALFCRRHDLRKLEGGNYSREHVERAARAECRIPRRIA